MSLRADREDYTRQEARVTDAYADLGDALAELAVDAKSASRRARARRRPGTDLLAVHQRMGSVRRLEEALDIALHDLATARGADA